MKRIIAFFALYSVLVLGVVATDTDSPGRRKMVERFPDGTPVDAWFREPMEDGCEHWFDEADAVLRLTDYGVAEDSLRVQTAEIQHVISLAAERGGRTIVVVPRGVFLSGSLWLRQGVGLYLEEGARLKGSERIEDFPVVETRIEGQSCRYFAALLNVEGLHGVRIGGRGTIDGNGLNYWKAFWLRRAWNPECTNKDEQRPRLVFISKCEDVVVSGLTLRDSPFWTTHVYKSGWVRLQGLTILSPAEPVKAPSTDAIDIDACHDVHVRRCYMSVNDDAIALKGGKGPWADQAEENGANERIIIEDCEYGFCHGCLTCGSEAVLCRNVILRRIRVGKAARLLWLKMRPDTPQHYEHIRVEDIEGEVTHFLFIHPWTQFFDLQGREDMPLSYGEDIVMQRCRMTCDHFFNVEASDQYRLRRFTFDSLDIEARHSECDESAIENFIITNSKITTR